MQHVRTFLSEYIKYADAVYRVSYPYCTHQKFVYY